MNLVQTAIPFSGQWGKIYVVHLPGCLSGSYQTNPLVNNNYKLRTGIKSNQLKAFEGEKWSGVNICKKRVAMGTIPICIALDRRQSQG